MALCALALGVGGCATDQEAAITPATVDASGLPVVAPMQDGDQVAGVPAGFIAFCLRTPDQCAEPKDGLKTIALTPLTWELLQHVNQTENEDIRQVDDEAHYGRADYWTVVTDGYGDCEDIALTKRKDLIDAGIPIGALRIAVVRTPELARHAVLTVSTDHGDFVLDSRSGDVKGWSEVPYIWIERQDANQAWAWDDLSHDSSPVMLALAQQQ
jgi:predicted transglutaminase-like cysteine proteinase